MKKLLITITLVLFSSSAFAGSCLKLVGKIDEKMQKVKELRGQKTNVEDDILTYAERNNINLGQLMGDHSMLEKLQAGETLPLEAFIEKYDPVTQVILKNGGLFSFSKKVTINLNGDKLFKKNLAAIVSALARKQPLLDPYESDRYICCNRLFHRHPCICVQTRRNI